MSFFIYKFRHFLRSGDRCALEDVIMDVSLFRLTHKFFFFFIPLSSSIFLFYNFDQTRIIGYEKNDDYKVGYDYVISNLVSECLFWCKYIYIYIF